MTQVYKRIKSNQQRAEHPNKRGTYPTFLSLLSLWMVLPGIVLAVLERPQAASWDLRSTSRELRIRGRPRGSSNCLSITREPVSWLGTQTQHKLGSES